MGQVEDKGYSIKEDGTIVRNTKSSKVNQLKDKISNSGNGGNPKHKKEGKHSYTWILLFFIVGIIIVGAVVLSGGEDSSSTDTDYQSIEEDTPINDTQNNTSEIEVSPDPLGLCPDKNHPHAIDLGIGTRWACCNVGANSQEDYGNYFAWGETISKSVYFRETYKWMDGDIYKLTKYCDDSSLGINGFTDNKATLELDDDAAYVNWGSNWRIPSLEQIEELLHRCRFTWTSYNGKEGCRIEGPNGNSIFLPAAGYRWSNNIMEESSSVHIWSHSLRVNSPVYAHSLVIKSDDQKRIIGERQDGLSVRPVRR